MNSASGLELCSDTDRRPPRRPRQEFHVHRSIRRALTLDTALFSVAGTVVFADVSAARTFASDLERYRASTGHPQPSVRAGEIVAMGLLDEVMHAILAGHREERGDAWMHDTLAEVRGAVGEKELDETLTRFCEVFPPAAVYRGEQSVADYLDDRVEGLSGRERALEELIVLRLTNENPACGRYRELFDETDLRSRRTHDRVFSELERRYAAAPVADDASGERAGATGRVSLIDVLRAPARAHPNSLDDQLAYARDHWGAYAGRFISRILRSMDVLREESKGHAAPGAGPPPAEVYRYEGTEEKRFSPDTEWMPGVVMIAKSTLVWLHQLGERYQRPITRLDQVPDDELDRLAASGFNALWLIGLWERSPASRRIKHLSGNPDAEASAYALYSYDIAAEMGGWEALETLRRRCSDRGIRLASDMVPNHTGIDSPWIHEHPDWFVHLDQPPYPAYSFTGENLSGRDDVGVYLEDHYFDRTDAAVVFRHTDQSGRDRYVYHGNDGTSMPWNDTAQLNYLRGEVREAVIQTILHVARNFPVIRFDAAMTLARKHVRRLWFPAPGSGGDIASRSEHGLNDAEFDAAMPREFWREVVDRVATEAPGTLLLAEAFWMMEGYFVRTLGMHRVYNSAFMNMLKREQNAEYREIIRTTLAFDPEILKRFVNFMNNPDEETAVTQFGTGDKYFAVATLLATLPGLPMFGHGQVEGLAEKYGMEFRRPYWDESPDAGLIARHEHEIFPLLRRRELFASASGFRLFDLNGPDGSTNENVFVYSNRMGDQTVLVAVNNSYERATGTIRLSAAYESGEASRTESIHAALGLSGGEKHFAILGEHRSGLRLLRRSSDIRDDGLPIALDGYQTIVFWRVHERADTDGSLARLAAELRGAWVPDVDLAVAGLAVAPVREAFAAVSTESFFAEMDEAMQGFRPVSQPRFDQVRADYRRLLEAASDAGTRVAVGRGLTAHERLLSTLVALPHFSASRVESSAFKRCRGRYYTGLRSDPRRRRLVFEWAMLKPLADAVGSETATRWGIETWSSEGQRAALLRAGLRYTDWWRSSGGAASLARRLLGDSSVLELIGFNTHAGVEFYHLETFKELLWFLASTAMVGLLGSSPLGGQTVRNEIVEAYRITGEIEAASAHAQGRASVLMAKLAGE